MALNDPATKLANKISDIVESKINKKTKKSSVIKTGKVVRIDSEGTPWVSISGSDQETPVNGEVLSSVKIGDSVSINIENGKCNILGNMDDPSIGSNEAKNVSNQEIKIAVEQEGTIGRAIDVENNKTMNKINEVVSDQIVPIEEAIEELNLETEKDIQILKGRTASSIEMADSAKTIADLANVAAEEAQAVAEATGQHFWHDDNGAHVTEVTQDEWNDSSSENYHSGFNSLFGSAGLLLRKALNNIASFTHSAVTFFDGQGNEPENEVANFGNSGVSLGKSNESHIFLESHGLTLFNENNTPLFRVSDERDPDASYTTSETFKYTGVQTSRYNLSMEATTANYSVWHRYLDRELQSTKDVNGFVITEEIDDIYINVPMIIVTYSTHDYEADTLAMSFGDGTVPAGASTGYISGTFGSEVSASKYCSFVFGKRLMATSDYQTVVGCFNEPVDGAFFIVADGRVSGNTEGPHNALVVQGDGNTSINGNLILRYGDSRYGNIFLDSGGSFYFVTRDANGNASRRYYFSSASGGTLGRQEYINGSWTNLHYYYPGISAGDTLSMNGYVACGYLTNAKKSDSVSIPLGRPISTSLVSSVTIVSGTITARQNGLYLFGSTATTPRNLSALTVSSNIHGGGWINITITGSEQTNAINNNPIAIYFDTLSLRFNA